MVSSLAERAGAFGVARVSLNFAMFREAFERGAEIGAGPIARAVAPGAAPGQPQLAAGVALPLQRQVPARVAAALHLLRVHLRPAPGGRGRRQRRGLPDDARRWPLLRRSGAEAGARAWSGRAGSTPPRSPRRSPRSPTRWPRPCPTEGLPEQVRVRREKLDRCGSAGIEPYPVGYPRTHTLAEVREQAGELPPDTRTGVTVVGRRAGPAQARRRQAVLRHPARRLRRPAGDGRPRRRGPGGPRALEARHRPRRPRGRDRRGDHHPARASCPLLRRRPWR